MICDHTTVNWPLEHKTKIPLNIQMTARIKVQLWFQIWVLMKGWRLAKIGYTALHSDAFFRSQRDINRHHCWLHFWKIQINSENFIFLHFWGRLGEIFQKWPYFWVFERIFFLKFWLKNYFFQAKTGFCNFYTNIYEYLDPDLKNLISGLSESVRKCAKSWKL